MKQFAWSVKSKLTYAFVKLFPFQLQAKKPLRICKSAVRLQDKVLNIHAMRITHDESNSNNWVCNTLK